MNPVKYSVLIVFCFFYTIVQAQELQFNLKKRGQNFVGSIAPNYFDSILLKPSLVKDNPLLNATGILYNSEHGNFNFRITKNIIDGSTSLLFKVSFGWFPMKILKDDSDFLSFVWDWDYRPPANKTDLSILKRANEILVDQNAWDNDDDRQCEMDKQNQQWSLYCALYVASFDVTKDFNHRNAAMEMVRRTIEEIKPNQKYQHRLMDFNNEVSFTEIKSVLKLAIDKFEKALHD